jgi:hypothetical protein
LIPVNKRWVVDWPGPFGMGEAEAGAPRIATVDAHVAMALSPGALHSIAVQASRMLSRIGRTDQVRARCI